jgi:hypothetical protein
MVGVLEDAEQAAIDVAILELLEGAEPGNWYEAEWDELPHSAQCAFAKCIHPRLIEVKGRVPGRFSFKLTARGEAVRLNREWITAAIRADAEALERDRLAAVNEAADVDPIDPQEELSLDARAVAVKTDHPDWTDKQVADQLGVNRTSLYKPNMEKFKIAKEALKSGRERYRKDG